MIACISACILCEATNREISERLQGRCDVRAPHLKQYCPCVCRFRVGCDNSGPSSNGGLLVKRMRSFDMSTADWLHSGPV